MSDVPPRRPLRLNTTFTTLSKNLADTFPPGSTALIHDVKLMSMRALIQVSLMIDVCDTLVIMARTDQLPVFALYYKALLAIAQSFEARAPINDKSEHSVIAQTIWLFLDDFRLMAAEHYGQEEGLIAFRQQFWKDSARRAIGVNARLLSQQLPEVLRSAGEV